MGTTTILNENWTFTQVGGGLGTAKDEWLPAQSVPTSVHVELLRLGKINDPFIGLAEWDVQWVGEADWIFKTNFTVSEDQLSQPNADLVFAGLDTYATVKLNGTQILETNNMFVPYRVSVKNTLKLGSNELLLIFPSTFLKGKQLEHAHGKNVLWNGDSSRLHVRKAQYNYGWDWGPVLMTVGPHLPISLHTYKARIEDLRISTSIADALDSAVITVTVTATPFQEPFTADISLISPTGETLRTAKGIQFSGTTSTLDFTLNKATPGELALWYPVSYGAQSLYTVDVKLNLSSSAELLDQQTKRIGLRRALIIQDPLDGQEGRSFLFEVNGIRIFAGGSNWIPADSFLTTITPQRYRAWLELLVSGNQNTIRVWGGGIYEADVFYDACDELGILVWQDFMFGCGQYPAYDEFLGRVVQEAEANVIRLRHHPSIIIWAGNNEDYQVAESFKLELDYADESPTSDFRSTNFPARHIYERTLPEIVKRLSDGTHYHRASPYSGFGLPTTDKKHGDLHQWNVWHGSQEPWHNWDILAGRFVSEFGMQGYPDIRTVDYWLGTDKAERYPQSRTMNSHNKADGFERRLELYLMENFKHAFDVESYVYYTQIMQAETLASAYRLWRREWRGRGKEYTAGALVWQINDCWPVTSWAIVDYFLRPKPAFFAISRELALYTVGMTRKSIKKPLPSHPDSAAFFELHSELQIWGTNSRLEAKEITLDARAYNLVEGCIVPFEVEGAAGANGEFKKTITLAPNASTEIWKGPVPGQPVRTSLSQPEKSIVVQARLIDPSNGQVLARYSNWPEPFKFIHFPSPAEVDLKLEVSSEGDQVTLTAARPIKGVVLDIEYNSELSARKAIPSSDLANSKAVALDEEDVKFSDQAIDLFPGDPQVVKVIGLKGRKLRARYLGDGSA